MPSLELMERAVASYDPRYIPTAVFFGGTSGMGRAMVEALARQTNGRVNIWLIGRNEIAANAILSSLPLPSDRVIVAREFISCDVSLLQNVQKLTDQLLGHVGKINILVISSGGIKFIRQETSEGLDLQMVLSYYSRFKIVENLMPALERAASMGEDARVMSILAAGMGLKVPLEDLDLKKWYNYPKVQAMCGVYNDIMVKIQSEKHPQIAFIHINPGLVDTPGNKTNVLARILSLLAWYWTKPVRQAAQILLYPLLSSEDFRKGGHWLSPTADKHTLSSNITTEVAQKVWDYSVDRTKM
ncbi:hypothetical protein FRB91_001763 [Serendipita sp. 411]|nr:hypothetical protein FRB91_001763 [Serendipita sp. 411]